MTVRTNVPQTEEEDDGGEDDGDDVRDISPGVYQDTGAGSQVVILVSRGTEVPGVWPAVTGAGCRLPAASPGETV